MLLDGSVNPDVLNRQKQVIFFLLFTSTSGLLLLLEMNVILLVAKKEKNVILFPLNFAALIVDFNFLNSSDPTHVGCNEWED